MGARPLRRAIQRYIEDPLADEVLAQNAEPGSTVDVDRAPDGDTDEDDEPNVKITIQKPVREREPVGVGAEGGSEDSPDQGGDEPETPAADLPDEPDVLPDVPDAPPAPEDEGGSEN